ncbi:MAG: ATP-sensitive inward rectifier potassium channel 10 [Acaryochloridaceae cyanobacterium SU_2_1]|nr:ATP-sensitive inward rectifier potassium channel 10 [Acaryochloridaceae cyanobacterium SU_2_1]
MPLVTQRRRRRFKLSPPYRSPQNSLLEYQNGKFSISGLGSWYSYWRDPYHLLLTIPWIGFLLVLAAGYIAINLLFALAYWLGGNGIANATPGNFIDAFFFSVQTFGSIGYGTMHPITIYTNLVVTLEAFTSILSMALITGLAFARFSRPAARVLFSRVAVITPYNGVPTLMFRTANQRQNQILEATLNLYFLQDEVSSEGDFMRHLYHLKLLRHRTPTFSLTLTVMHPIDQDSPLYGATLDSLEQTKANLIVSLTGIDDTVAQALHARYTYGPRDILWNHKFIDVFHRTPDGHRYIDYTHFHDVTPQP